MEGGISVGPGSGASSASHCVTRWEILSGPQSSDLEKRGAGKVSLRHSQLQHPAPWPGSTSFLLISVSMITNSQDSSSTSK